MSPSVLSPAKILPVRLRLALAGLAALTAGLRADPGLTQTPLATRSGPAGRTMFTELPPEQTGIKCENFFADPLMWGAHYTQLVNGGLGTGIAVADFDSDGRPDVFVVSKTGPSRLFRNLGNWKFTDVTVAAGLATTADLGRTDRTEWTQGATWADVNNDGQLDLYVCRFNAPNQLFINQGNGTFKEEAQARGLAVIDASEQGAFFDYDRDGWLDVYLQTNLLDPARAPNGQRDYLFHNRGDGTFENVTDRAGIAGESLTHSAGVWDYDGDGWPDLYVANDFTTPDRLYHNNRDGTFTDVINTVVPHLPYSAMGSDQGDLNNDGLIDFLVADMAATTHEKDHRGMAYSRTLKGGEGEPANTEAPQYSHNALYLNSGTGRSLEAAYLAGLAATDWTWSVRFEDLDNDGLLDLHITNGMIREYQNADLLDRSFLAASPAERINLLRASPRLAEANLAYRNRGDLQFEEIGRAWGLDQVGVSFGAAFGDFDEDGDLDVIFANLEGHPTVLRNDSPDGHRLILALRGTASNRFGVGAVVTIETAQGTQVRQLETARGYLSSSEPIVHFGLGAETSVRSLTVVWPNGRRQSFSGLAADQRYTVTEPASAEPTAGRPAVRPQFTEEGATRGLDLQSQESFDVENQPLVPVRFDRLGPALALGDINHDGRIDVVLGGTGRQPAQIRFGAAGGFAAGGNLPPATVDDGPLLLLDYDGDGLVDLLQTRAGANRSAGSPAYQPVLQRNTGSGFEPQPAALPPLPLSVGAAVAADFDHDGRLDVFLGARVLPNRYPQSPRSALLRNEGGRFTDVTDALAPALREAGMIRSALWSDADGDGWPDLLLAPEWGSVRYFHNDAGKGFTERSAEAGFSAAGTGWWTSLASADFNGDGRPDYVAGNTGLNTLYQPPALLYAGNFKGGGGAPQVIEAYREGDSLYPRRTRKELAAQIPALLARFPRNDAYARSTLPALLGEDRLAAARLYTATEFRSGIFLSQPDGTYRFSALPRLAQIAPVQGIAAGDCDGDGHADLYVVQNSFSPNPGTGRFDGGLSLLLHGDGRGNFVPVVPAQSGLIVPGDAKALVMFDLDDDGWPDFLVSRNNSTTLAWHNRGIPGRHSFQVRLQGRPGNPTAVGAALQLELADGTVQATEIAAGGGYYSQAPAAVFFGWPEGNPPRRLSVRWPDGSTSETALTEVPTVLEIKMP